MNKTYIFSKVCISATWNNKVPNYIMGRSMVFLGQSTPPTDSKEGNFITRWSQIYLKIRRIVIVFAFFSFYTLGEYHGWVSLNENQFHAHESHVIRVNGQFHNGEIVFEMYIHWTSSNPCCINQWKCTAEQTYIFMKIYTVFISNGIFPGNFIGWKFVYIQRHITGVTK